MSTAPRVVAVVPLYCPGPAARVGIRGLAAQVDAVVLVDDGSPAGAVDDLAGAEISGVQLIRSPENRGVAHALNIAVQAALRGSADVVLTADQDSVFAADYVERALALMDDLRASGTAFAAIAAGVVDGKPNPSRPMTGSVHRQTFETIQSGMLFPAAALRRLGPFDESLFIDCVDTDYILRGSVRGLPTVLAPDCAMQHAVGEGIAVRLPAVFRRRDRVVPYHGPVRRYYIVRNRLRLVGRYAFRRPSWALMQAAEQAKSIAADLVWGVDPRPALLLASVRGAVDGVIGRGGRIPSRLEDALRRWERRGRSPASSIASA